MPNQSFPIGDDLFNAILAMDSYNRTQNQGVYVNNDGAYFGDISGT